MVGTMFCWLHLAAIEQLEATFEDGSTQCSNKWWQWQVAIIDNLRLSSRLG